MNAPPPVVRVVVVSRASPVWGAQLRLLQTAPMLRALGVELVLAVPAANAFHERWSAAGFEVVTLPDPGPDELRDEGGRRLRPLGLAAVGLRTGARAVSLARVVRQADVVLSFSRHAHVEVALAARIARRPVVVEVVDIVQPGLGRRVLHLAARAATVVVANNRATGESVGGAARDLRIIHPGVDVERFAPGPADERVRALLGPPDAPVVGILGRLDPGKGIELVVAAFALGGRPQLATAALAVVGDRGVAPEAYVERLREEAVRRLGERVRFVGRLDDVPAVLRSLDVLVNASDAEPFGRSVLEAQAAGVPVVASDAGGIPEFVSDGVTGILFRGGDAAALADALERALTDDALRAELARAGREQAVSHFTNASVIEVWAELYRELAS